MRRHHIPAAERRRLWSALGATVLSAGLLAGCGATEGEVAYVEITDEGFNPALQEVSPGTEVRFWSNTPRPHTVTTAREEMAGEPTLPPGGEEFDSGRIREGETFAVTFDAVGEHVYWCEIHRDEQMVGVIRVSES